MKIIADLHIHSHFSLATSKQLNPEFLDHWARIKGITVIGTGDFTHPGWINELKEKLEPAEEGLFKLKDTFRQKKLLSKKQQAKKVRFLLTAEVSSIYKKTGAVRKVHNLILAPDFHTVERIQEELEAIGGNIRSDGRPILGLDSRNLLEICLSVNENILFVPAHIWTPWFSALGAKSGFNSIDECFDDLRDHIYAVETGLSSDPAMNWICSFLDKYTLISNSDAHSPEKLGREANLLDCELSYSGITNTIKKGSPDSFLGTVEFFPAEGKYHFDGHRKCGVCLDPFATLENDYICPVCGTPVTVGVMHRVAELADRDDILERKNRAPFHSVIPLKEIISEILGVRPGTKKVASYYNTLMEKASSEFDVLLSLPVDEINRIDNDILAEAIARMRSGQVNISHGYDGEFGRITVFSEQELSKAKPCAYTPSKTRGPRIYSIPFDIKKYQHHKSVH